MDGLRAISEKVFVELDLFTQGSQTLAHKEGVRKKQRIRPNQDIDNVGWPNIVKEEGQVHSGTLASNPTMPVAPC